MEISSCIAFYCLAQEIEVGLEDLYLGTEFRATATRTYVLRCFEITDCPAQHGSTRVCREVKRGVATG